MIKLFPVLYLLAQQLPLQDEFIPQHRCVFISFYYLCINGRIRENGVVITVSSVGVTKTYTSFDGNVHVNRMREIYKLLESHKVPNVDRLISSYINDPIYGTSLFLQPTGTSYIPQTETELRNAIVCVLKALSVGTSLSSGLRARIHLTGYAYYPAFPQGYSLA
jgi:hypothetical protein